MIKNISRALTCLFVGAALTACTGDDTGDSDTDPTTTASTDPTSTTSETGTTTDATDATTDSTTTTDGTSDGTDSTTTTDGTSVGTSVTDSTTDATTTTTDGTTDGTTEGTTITDGTTDGTTTTTTDGGMGFAADVYPIISASCSCHLNGPKAGLEMPDAETSYANLVDVESTQAPGVLRVATDMPEASYIINKIENTHLDVGGKGNQMPPGGPLSPAEIMTFKDWIADGAMP